MSARAQVDPGGRELGLAATDRLLMLAPHPDDEALAAGGLLQHAVERGAEVRVLYVTSGENNPWAQRANEWRWGLGPEDRIRWGARRWEEALAALARLGVAEQCAKRLGFPDQGLTDLLLADGEELIGRLGQEITSWRPTILLVPAAWDVHPDHSALALLAQFALMRVSGTAGRATVMRYVVHGRSRPPARELVRVTLSEEMRERKRQAILCHRTQLPLRRGFLLAFAGDAERFALVAGSPEPVPGHPVSDAALEEGSLHLTIARPLPPGIGRPRVLVAAEGSEGSRTRLCVELCLRGHRARLLHPAAPAGSPAIPLLLDPGRARLVLPLPGAFPAGGTRPVFVKVERTAMRRLGLFDSFGWRQVPVPLSARRLAEEIESREAAVERAVPVLAPVASSRLAEGR